MKGKSIHQSVTFSASPHEVYELLMDSKKHAAFTGEAASISRKVGGKIKAYGDYILGKNLELVADKKIVQLWRASDWPKGEYSTVTFIFIQIKTGAEISFTQTGVPAEKVAEIKTGWIDFYWKPMKEYLESKK